MIKARYPKNYASAAIIPLLDLAQRQVSQPRCEEPRL
jgi:NADH:ubiquinone oxidoreductase subunit E